MRSPIQLIGLAAASTVVVSIYQNVSVTHEQLIAVPLNGSTQVTHLITMPQSQKSSLENARLTSQPKKIASQAISATKPRRKAPSPRNLTQL